MTSKKDWKARALYAEAVADDLSMVILKGALQPKPTKFPPIIHWIDGVPHVYDEGLGVMQVVPVRSAYPDVPAQAEPKAYGPVDPEPHMTDTRSYDDIQTAYEMKNDFTSMDYLHH